MIHYKDSKLLREDLEPNSVHAVVTDPPYFLNLMNLNWDKVLPSIDIWAACFEVLRPGGFCLAFGYPRLYHRLACQLEDVGFEIKDCLCWGYATGNPRPLNIDKAIAKTDDIAATRWTGWANNLKNSWESIVMAQKPLEGTYAENVLAYNVGGLNIDECRIPYKNENDMKSLASFKHFTEGDYGDKRYFSANSGNKKQCNVHPLGRWPANLVWLDPTFVLYDHIFMIPKPAKGEKGVYNEHSTVKPVHLMERLIKLVTPRPSVVKEDVVVLDPFLGSGSTGVAAQNLHRKFEGYELDRSSYDVAKRRINERTKNKLDMYEV